MKVRPLVILGAVGTGAAGACALVFRRSEYPVSMHPDDWPGMELEDAHRRYRSPGHALHHVKELAGLTGPVAGVYLRQAISPAFREQILITTSVSNNCPIWIGVHSAFGRNAGLTREQIESLQRLELDGFERREYIALNWVRQFLTCPGGVPAGVEEEFTSTFTLKEQACIKASMKSVFCINLLISTTMQGKLGGRIMGMVCGE